MTTPVSPRGPGSVVLDLDGVIYLDGTGIPGAGTALASLTDAGFRIAFATNNSTRTPEAVAAHIRDRTGYRAESHQVVTSTMVAVHHVAQRYGSVLVVGPPALESSLRDAGVTLVTTVNDEPEAVVVGLDRAIDYERIDRAARAIRAGASFVATNVDPTYPTPTGLAPGAGSIVAAIASASGATPTSCGKPGDEFADLLRSHIDEGPVWVVGDRLDTDIALALAQGWRSILVLSGVTSGDDPIPIDLRPDVITASIVEVPGLVGAAPRRTDRG